MNTPGKGVNLTSVRIERIKQSVNQHKAGKLSYQEALQQATAEGLRGWLKNFFNRTFAANKKQTIESQFRQILFTSQINDCVDNLLNLEQSKENTSFADYHNIFLSLNFENSKFKSSIRDIKLENGKLQYTFAITNKENQENNDNKESNKNSKNEENGTLQLTKSAHIYDELREQIDNNRETLITVLGDKEVSLEHYSRISVYHYIFRNIHYGEEIPKLQDEDPINTWEFKSIIEDYLVNAEKYKYYALVFSGGGAKGANYAAILEALGEHRLKEVKKVAGASAGAITASLVAAGIKPYEFSEFVATSNLKLSQEKLKEKIRAQLYKQVKGFLAKLKDKSLELEEIKNQLINNLLIDKLFKEGINLDFPNLDLSPIKKKEITEYLINLISKLSPNEEFNSNDDMKSFGLSQFDGKGLRELINKLIGIKDELIYFYFETTQRVNTSFEEGWQNLIKFDPNNSNQFDLTFEQLEILNAAFPDAGFKSLSINATLAGEFTSEVLLSYATTPNMPISLAAIASAALPIVFPAVDATKYFPQEVKENLLEKDTTFVATEENLGQEAPAKRFKGAIKLKDGGIMNNTPFKYLIAHGKNVLSLAFSGVKGIYNKELTIWEKLLQKVVAGAPVFVYDREITRELEYLHNHHYIDTGKIGTIDFKRASQQFYQLLLAGKKAFIQSEYERKIKPQVKRSFKQENQLQAIYEKLYTGSIVAKRVITKHLEQLLTSSEEIFDQLYEKIWRQIKIEEIKEQFNKQPYKQNKIISDCLKRLVDLLESDNLQDQFNEKFNNIIQEINQEQVKMEVEEKSASSFLVI